MPTTPGIWCPRQDSNLELLLRTELFYPLNYRGVAPLSYRAASLF